MNKNQSIAYVTLVGLVLLVAAIALAQYANGVTQNRISKIDSFEECAAAGYPIMESFPEQCATPDGRSFTREIEEGDTPTSTDPIDEPVADPRDPVGEGECFVGGCSSQICSDDPDAVSTCEYRAEYACYRTATCERQPGGACGWTETPELLRCLATAN